MSNAAAVALIIFGGGWGAEGTQASIETHVLALRDALGPDRSVRVLFAGGDPAIRDVQVSEDDESEASSLLGIVFDRQDHLRVAYRPSKLTSASVASKRAVLDALRGTADNERGTIVFGVGHGSPEAKDLRATVELFGPDDSLAVDELARALDGGPPRRAPIAFVLGHCHSGAFTHLVFMSGDPKARVAEPARCVFAAVPADRPAAGCSPDAEDPEARAYMALIAEGFAKGKMSLADAHAFARINDRTIDVPVSTSETWLAQTLGKKAPAVKAIVLDRLLARARASERSVLAELKPGPKATPASVEADLEAIDRSIDQLDDALGMLQDDYDRVRRQLLDALLLRYPELANPYHRESRRLMAGEAGELVAFLKSRRELLELDARNGESAVKERERFDLEKKGARLERWLNAARAVANEDALRRGGNKAAIRTLDKLLACESMAP